MLTMSCMSPATVCVNAYVCIRMHAYVVTKRCSLLAADHSTRKFLRECVYMYMCLCICNLRGICVMLPFVALYIYMYIRMYMYVFICVFVHVCMYTYFARDTHHKLLPSAALYIRMHIHVCTCVCMYM